MRCGWATGSRTSAARAGDVTTIIDVAREIALKSHAGAINKFDGELYLLHVNRVAVGSRSQALRAEVDPVLAEATAWLHDVVEDTTWTIDDVRAEFQRHLGPLHASTYHGVADAVWLLTKPDDGSVTNEEYYRAIAQSPLATAVKRADMQDNFSRNHKIEDEATRLRMAAKYSLGMEILG
jgi:(p)ppGpp synthase/HD superfamily hydrolase